MSEEDKLDSWSDKLEASGNSREHALQDVQREIREVVDEAFKEHRGTREDKTDSLSERTLQDAQRDIQERRVKLGKTRKMYQDAQLAYETVQAASSKDPNNKVLSKELEHAKKLRNKYKELMELSQNLLAMKEANHFKLQVAARAVSKRTRKFLFCVYFVPLYCLSRRLVCRVASLFTAILAPSLPGSILYCICPAPPFIQALRTSTPSSATPRNASRRMKQAFFKC